MFFLKDLPTPDMTSQYARYYAPLEPEQIVDVLTELRRASLLIRDIEAYFRERDFSLLRFLILIIIDRQSDRDYLQFSEIVEKVDVSKPVVTRTIKCMVEAGLLSMHGDEADKRIKNYSLTDAGKACIQDLFPGYFKLLGAAAGKSNS